MIELRRTDKAFAALPAHEQYARAGGIDGVVAHGDHELEIVLAEPNAQILYWFAMPFTTPLAWEAVAYYDGKGRAASTLPTMPSARDPIGSRCTRSSTASRWSATSCWYGSQPTSADAPGAAFSLRRSTPRTSPTGRVDAAYAGRRMPFVDRIEFYRERENIPRFNKLLQGYYDDGGIIKESFDAVVQGDRLSPQMQARGMRLDKTVEPSIRYIGFNMDDPVVGAASRRARPQAAPGHERRHRLQPIPRAVPERSRRARPDAAAAGHLRLRRELQEPLSPVRPRPRAPAAGRRRLPNGIDPATNTRLKLSFDTSATTAAANLQFEYLADAWRQLGLDVEINATTYNQFQDKMRRGAYQIFIWGWIADFPDPENFLFLLECQNARSKSGGPNTANFCNAEYDRLYQEMKDLPNNDASRRADQAHAGDPGARSGPGSSSITKRTSC